MTQKKQHNAEDRVLQTKAVLSDEAEGLSPEDADAARTLAENAYLDSFSPVISITKTSDGTQVEITSPFKSEKDFELYRSSTPNLPAWIATASNLEAFNDDCLQLRHLVKWLRSNNRLEVFLHHYSQEREKLKSLR